MLLEELVLVKWLLQKRSYNFYLVEFTTAGSNFLKADLEMILGWLTPTCGRLQNFVIFYNNK